MLRLRKIQWTKKVLVPQIYKIIFHLCNQENNKELMTKIKQKKIKINNFIKSNKKYNTLVILKERNK